MGLDIRFNIVEDVPDIVSLAQRVFPFISPIPLEFWTQLESGDHKTVVAVQDGEIVGMVPWDMRDFEIRPGVSIKAAFCHLVGVHEKVRDQGVGSQMMRFAKEKLVPFCDGRLVYTGSEGRAPYTFYEKNGFIDLHYCRRYKAAHLTAQPAPEVEIQPLDEEHLDENSLFQVYQQAYGEYAGSPRRHPGYWKNGLHSVIYIELPADFFLATTNEKEQLAGYAIFGGSGKSVTLYELAAVPQKRSQVTRRLLQAIQNKSVELGAEKIDTVIPHQHPMRPDLVAMGFTPASRKIAKVTAGQIHDFGQVWRLLAGENPEIALKIWTPSRTIELPGNGPSVSLEMKETTLQRLFMCRENFNDLYVAEWITSPTDLLPVETLQRIFRPAQWVFHYFDYI